MSPYLVCMLSLPFEIGFSNSIHYCINRINAFSGLNELDTLPNTERNLLFNKNQCKTHSQLLSSIHQSHNCFDPCCSLFSVHFTLLMQWRFGNAFAKYNKLNGFGINSKIIITVTFYASKIPIEKRKENATREEK